MVLVEPERTRRRQTDDDQAARTTGETMGTDQTPTEPGEHDGTQREQAQRDEDDSEPVVTGG